MVSDETVFNSITQFNHDNAQPQGSKLMSLISPEKEPTHFVFLNTLKKNRLVQLLEQISNI